MLDDRLIGTIFTLPTAESGEIQLYGIFYHYKVAGVVDAGAQVVVVAADRSGLTVRQLGSELDF